MGRSWKYRPEQVKVVAMSPICVTRHQMRSSRLIRHNKRPARISMVFLGTGLGRFKIPQCTKSTLAFPSTWGAMHKIGEGLSRRCDGRLNPFSIKVTDRSSSYCVECRQDVFSICVFDDWHPTMLILLPTFTTSILRPLAFIFITTSHYIHWTIFS